MDSRPLLERIAAALAHADLEAVRIGNAAAALHGAAVTTVDFDFFVRDNPRTRAQIREFAGLLGARVHEPDLALSGLISGRQSGRQPASRLHELHQAPPIV